MDVFAAGVVSRFWDLVLKQETETGHWFWIGAIADDGYGRFSLNHDGATDVVRPHRYSYALAHGIGLKDFDSLMHLCDIPLCVRATTDALSHLFPGDLSANMRDRQRKGRTRNQNSFTWRGLPRERFTATSRALRKELIEYGFTRPETLAALIGGNDPEAPTLF